MHFSKKFGLLALCALISTIPVSSFATGTDDGTTVTSKVYVDNKLDLKQNKLPYDATANLIIAPTTDGGNATKRAIVVAGSGITSLTNNSASTDKEKIPTAYAVKEAIGNIDVNTNTVNGAPLSNAASYYYGESSTAAGTAAKEVTISSITSLNAGQIIAVKTTNASTVANNTLTLKKDNETSFGAKPILYRGAALTTETAPLVWTAGGVSFFVYDGTSWNFAGGGADNTNTDSVTTVTNSDNSTVGTTTTANDGSIKVTKDGTTTYPVVRGWSTKQNKPNKSGETTAAAGKVLMYTSSSLDENVAARYVQVPVSTGDPNSGGTVNSSTPLASIWVE